MSDPLAPVRGLLAARVGGWAAMDLPAIRADFAAFLAQVGPQGQALARAARETRVAGLPAVWIGDPAAPPGLYLHGGGFQIGGIAAQGGLVARLAQATGLRLLLPAYRLAPEHRYPAAGDDALAVYRAMVASGEPPQAMLGDSAGGGLALLTMIRARDAGLPLPRALILLSPWLDLSLSGASYTALVAEDPFSTPAALRAMARSYLGRGGPDPRDPAVSPLSADLSGLPPMLVHAGACDITLDDSRTLAARPGTAVTLRVYPGMCHHFQVFEALPQAAASIHEIGAWWRALVSPADAGPTPQAPG